jgi:hypothetical protein
VVLPPLLLTTSGFERDGHPVSVQASPAAFFDPVAFAQMRVFSGPAWNTEHALGRLQFAELARKLFARSIDARHPPH